MSKTISLTNATNSFLVIGAETDRQLLYSSDRPKFRFPIVEEKQRGKTILKSNEKPVWSPIIVEIPTRFLASTKEWIDSKSSKELRMVVVNQDGHIIEEWQIKDAMVVSHNKNIGRMVGIEVIRLVIRYNWARRVR